MPLYRYESTSQCDLLVAQMWAQMEQSGDLERIFGACDLSLSALFRLFAKPNEMYYKLDDAGIWLAAWFEPIMSCAFLGLYVRSDRRDFGAAQTFRQIAKAGLQAYGVLIGITQQEELLPIHRAMGYTVLGMVPGLYHGNDAWLVTLTKEGFANGSKQRQVKRTEPSRRSGRAVHREFDPAGIRPPQEPAL